MSSRTLSGYRFEKPASRHAAGEGDPNTEIALGGFEFTKNCYGAA